MSDGPDPIDTRLVRRLAAILTDTGLSEIGQPKAGETAQLLDLLARHHGACGIVYCATRAKTERVAARLVDKGLPAVAFHAGLDPEHKRAALARLGRD